MAALMIGLAVIWLAAGIVGLPVTQSLAALLAVPYGSFTAYLVWARVRAR
jgi:hypothetical protein